MNRLDWNSDRKLYGALPHHRDRSTRLAWDAHTAAKFGLPMTAAMLAIFRECTGRQHPRPGGYSETVTITGRQSGKSTTSAEDHVYDVATAPKALARGTINPLVAQDARGATRTLFRYVMDTLEGCPMLRAMIESATSDSVTLTNGATIPVYPARPGSLRGIRALVATMDEPPFMVSTEGRPTDVETRRALLPTLATTGGRLSIVSSPAGQTGLLWDLYREHYGKDDSPVLIWKASAPVMNPTLPSDYLERMRTTDPEGYRSEVEGEFRAGVSALFDPEALDAVTGDYRERLPEDRVHYFFATDPSAGGKDAFTAAVAHNEGQLTIVDAVRAWHSKNPSGVVAEIAEWLKTYRARQIEGDKYAGQFPREAFRKAGIEYRVADQDRSQLYLGLLPLVNSGAVLLPNDDKLLRELRGIERRRGTSGRDRCDHRPGEHDDRATAVATAVAVARRALRHTNTVTPGSITRRSPWAGIGSADSHRDRIGGGWSIH